MDAQTLVELAGPVTRAEVVACRDALREAVAQGRPVRVGLAESGPWDLAGLQLMLALKVSCDRNGLPLSLADAPGVFREVSERAGLRDQFAAMWTSSP